MKDPLKTINVYIKQIVVMTHIKLTVAHMMIQYSEDLVNIFSLVTNNLIRYIAAMPMTQF